MRACTAHRALCSCSKFIQINIAFCQQRTSFALLAPSYVWFFCGGSAALTRILKHVTRNVKMHILLRMPRTRLVHAWRGGPSIHTAFSAGHVLYTSQMHTCLWSHVRDSPLLQASLYVPALRRTQFCILLCATRASGSKLRARMYLARHTICRALSCEIHRKNMRVIGTCSSSCRQVFSCFGARVPHG